MKSTYLLVLTIFVSFFASATASGLEPCELCHEVVKFLDDHLEDPITEDMVKKLLDDICDKLPSIMKLACTGFVDQYVDDIIDYLVTTNNPHGLCRALKLCHEDAARFGGNVAIASCDATNPSQQWQLVDNGLIKSKYTSSIGGQIYVLDVAMASKDNGVNVQVWEVSSAANQLWEFDPSSGNVKATMNERCLTVVPSPGEDYENVKVFTCSGTDSSIQQWSLDNSTGLFTSKYDSSKCLTVEPLSATPASSTTRPIVIGHRGNTFEAPENTVPAFRSAIEMGADGFETDFWLTSDNILVLCHDPTVDRTSNCSGKIRSHTFQDLRENCDFGSWFDPKFAGTKIPTFEEAVQVAYADYPANGHAIIMDLKTLPTLEEEAMRLDIITETLAKYPGSEGLVVASCREESQAVAYRARLNGTSVQRLESQPKWDEKFFEGQIADAVEGYSLSESTVTHDFVRAAHRHLMSVFVWTPDTEKSQVNALTQLGADGMITGDPRLALDLIEMQHRF